MTQPLMSLSATMVVGAIGGVGAMERWEKKKIYRDKTDKQNEATGTTGIYKQSMARVQRERRRAANGKSRKREKKRT